MERILLRWVDSSPQFILKFFANHRHLGRGFNPDTNSPTGDSNHGYRDVIPNQNPLANLSTEHKHGGFEKLAKEESLEHLEMHAASSQSSLTECSRGTRCKQLE